MLSPFLEEYRPPEGGYKFVNGNGEVRDAEEFIREAEAQMAREAQDSPPPPPPPLPPLKPDDYS